MGDTKNWYLAAQAFETAAKKSPNSALFQSHLAISYARISLSNSLWSQLAMKDTTLTAEKKAYLIKSISHMEKACFLNPFDKRYKLNLSWLYLFDEQYIKADTTIQSILKNDPDNELYLASLIVVKLMRNKKDEAIKTIQILLRNFPLFIESRFWLFLSKYFSKNELNRLIQDNIYYLENNKNDLDPVNIAHLGHLYFYNQQFNNAKIFFHKAIVLRPYLQGSHYQLGRLYYAEKDTNNAIREFLLAAMTGFPNAYFCLGNIFQELGEEDMYTRMFRIYNLLTNDNFIDRYKRITLEKLYKLSPLTDMIIPKNFLSDIYPLPNLALWDAINIYIK